MTRPESVGLGDLGTVIYRRQPRRDAPDLPEGEVVLDPPPELPKAGGRQWSQILMVLPMLAGAGAMALMFSSNRSGPMGYVLGGMFGISALGMVAMGFMNGGTGPNKSEMAQSRRQYMRHLSLHRAKVQRTARQQRLAMEYRHPDPDALWATAASHRLWERRVTDADFGVVRIGVGPQALATPLIPPQTPSLDRLEPLCAAALRRFVQTYSTVEDLPIAMAINGFNRVHISGEIDRARAMVRAVIAQLAVHHSPDDVLVAVCAGPDSRAQWEWAKWLPHAFHGSRKDALGQVRLVAPTMPALEAMLDDLLATRPRFNPAGASAQIAGAHIVVVLDGGDTAGSSHIAADKGVEGVTVLDLSTQPARLLDAATLVLTIDDEGRLRSTTQDAETAIGVADSLGAPEMESLARQLAPYRMSLGSTGEQAISTALGLAELLDIGDPFEYDAARGWVPRAARDLLRVPIGIGLDGQPVDLDIKESAQDGMGPHGLLIGATGSGKSELLRTLVLALAASHDSETLNFVLVDFKGGATFTKLDRLPHTSAVITNLSDELPLVDRMTDAINGELLRRQELLRSAGNYSSLRDYEKARLAGAPLAPMPSLLIICDEFSELLSAKPDFIDMFVQIGRVGRSLGVHLLLASQRLEEGRLRGLDTHLSYRISLRTNSAMESRVVLSSPDAFDLPRAPGHGYLKYGTDPLVRFRAAYVSGLYRRETGGAMSRDSDDALTITPYDTRYVAPKLADDDAAESQDGAIPEMDEELGESLLDIMVERLEGKGVPAHRVWLPPLDEPPTLDQLVPSLVRTSSHGLTTSDEHQRGGLSAAIGLIDRPLEQRREPLRIDLAGANGNVAVVGGTQSGKSTALRTIITGLALASSPAEVQFYCLDFGGGSLSTLRALPHVGSVAARADVNVIRRTVAELQTLIREREELFARASVEGMASYRRRKAAGEFADDPFGDVFLVVDGWATVRSDFEAIEPLITDIAQRGLAYGVHVIIAASRWMDLRAGIRDMLGTRIELRLGDPSDSELDRKTALNVPKDTPGRGITVDKMHMLIGLPRIDGTQTVEDLGDGVGHLVRSIADAWPGPPAPRVRLLPPMVPAADLRPDPAAGIVLGIAESDLRPVYLEPEQDAHFLLFGDSEVGKSSFLRAVGTRITERYTPAEARIILVDYRRSLLGAITTKHVIGYGTSAQSTADIVAEVVGVLAQRIPGPDVTPEQLRSRSWWQGPDVYLLVDDYDLVSAGSANPLLPLVEYLAQARDIGLHMFLTRRSGGAGRSLYDPVIQRIRELASPGIVMSGDKDEGVLLGNYRPQPLPPGRGMMVSRKRGSELIQLEYLPPPDFDHPGEPAAAGAEPAR